jgi:hypothetical protein
LFELLFKYSRATFDRGEFLFASGWPLWVLVGLILIGGGFVIASVLRYRQDLHPAKVGVIGLLQILIVSLVLTMLWQPALLTQTLRPQENSVAVLVDTSASMGYGEGQQSRLQQAIETLTEGPLPELTDNFNVDLQAFAGTNTSRSSPCRRPDRRRGSAMPCSRRFAVPMRAHWPQ